MICAYFAEYEMAIATAMSRNKCFNEETASKLEDDIKAHCDHIKHNEKTLLCMKIYMLIYKTNPKLFIRFYRVVYLVTGR